MLWVCRILLFGTALCIGYQDFKARLIYLWLVVFFGVTNVAQYLLQNTVSDLAGNTIFCVLYFLLCYGVLHLVYYVKTKRFQKIIDVKLGMGDVLVFFVTGICLEPSVLVGFFTATFIAGMLYYLLFLKKNREIPLAGILTICYVAYLLASDVIFV